MARHYHSVELLPTIAASIQHAGTFANNSILFDWTPIQVPKGSNALISAVVLVRSKGDATPTANHVKMDLLFSKTNTVSLGTQRVAPLHHPNNDIMGHVNLEASHYALAGVSGSSVGTMGASEARHPLILTGDINTGDNVGYDTIYVAGVAGETVDFQSINAIAEAGAADAASTQVITMDGTSMDVREHFAAGDIVHIGTTVGTPAADSLIGTIASADSTTQITLEAVSPTALVDGDILYNINPIKIILSFER
jgi:hypothetical protein